MQGTVLVTGATGFGGWWLAEAYRREGWRVVGTTHTPARPGPPGIELAVVDLEDAPAVRKLVAAVRPDVVQHLAAQSSVAVARTEPLATVQRNVAMQANVLDALLAEQLRCRVVVVGSCDEYGRIAVERNPVSEDFPLRPLNAYALSKVTQDLMGFQYHAAFGLPVIRARPFLQLGPRRDERFVAGTFACQVAEIAAGLRPPVITTGNLDPARDFTDVRDVARALLLLAERGTPGEVYNIASGRAHRLAELLTLLLQLAGVEAEIRPDPARVRPGEMPLLVGDSTRLRRATGWDPGIAFEQSVRDTLDYWRSEVAQRVPAMRGMG